MDFKAALSATLVYNKVAAKQRGCIVPKRSRFIQSLGMNTSKALVAHFADAQLCVITSSATANIHCSKVTRTFHGVSRNSHRTQSVARMPPLTDPVF